jgi:hypothetical protein
MVQISDHNSSQGLFRLNIKSIFFASRHHSGFALQKLSSKFALSLNL